MITFEDIKQTKDNMEKAIELIDNIKTYPSTFKYINDINTNSMNKINQLIGKYYNQPKKCVVHTWKNNNNSGYTNKYELQISKAGIGRTPSGYSQIQKFEKIFSDETGWRENKGLIGDVIKDKDIYEKTLNNLSDKGKEILKIVKEAYEKSEIELYDKNRNVKKIEISNDEREIFNLKINKLYIEIEDGYNQVNVHILKNINENNGYGYGDKSLFLINNLNETDSTDYLYILFMQYHYDEILNTLNKYIEDTKETKEKWTKFNELLNEKLAKYLILTNM
jgi:hypothetical protein